MSKSLFRDDYRYTPEAENLAQNIHSSLRDTFDEWMKKGYSPREIASVIVQEVSMLESLCVINYAAGEKVGKND